MKISQSEVDAFLLCKRKHYYAFIMKLEKRTKGEALSRGIIGHEFFQTFFTHLKSGTSFDDSLKATKQYVLQYAASNMSQAKIISQAWQLMEIWLKKERASIEGWKILYVEETFSVKLNDEVDYPFTPDLVIQEGPYVCVLDWKFTYNFYTTVEQHILGQLPKYVAALRFGGTKVAKAYYVQLRYRSLKNIESPGELVRMDDIPLGETRLRTTFRQQSRTAVEIARYKPTATLDDAIPALTKAVCNYCSFKELCEAQLNDLSVENVIQAEYQASTYGYDKGEGKSD